MTEGERTATDPVCGMTVDKQHASTVGLTAEHEGTAYYFCGRGCKLDFQEAPGKYLDRSYKPTM
jgi:YHS domain-containing protein